MSNFFRSTPIPNLNTHRHIRGIGFISKIPPRVKKCQFRKLNIIYQKNAEMKNALNYFLYPICEFSKNWCRGRITFFLQFCIVNLPYG